MPMRPCSPQCSPRRRAWLPLAATAVCALLQLQLPLTTAHDDYLSLVQPEIYESPCAAQWREMSAHFSDEKERADHEQQRPIMFETEPSELHVNLTVRLDRFESRYVGFNTRTFNGKIPAPTIKVCPGDTLVVRMTNALGDGAVNNTNLHLHGMDNVMVNIPPGKERVYSYDIRKDHPPGTFWYHPHAHGLVNTQLGGLMAGALIVVDRPGDFPEEIAAMEDLVLILQGVCVENCHIKYDTIVQALNNRYDTESMSMPMDMDMDMEEGDEAEDEDEDDGQMMEEFPIDFRVEADSPLNDTSLLHVYVNGQYLPEIHMRPGEFKRFRYINAIPNNVAELVVPHCEMHLLARDGIYIPAASRKDVVVLPPGGRADLALRCPTAGTFFVETEANPSRNSLLGGVNKHRAPSQQIVSLRVIGDEAQAMAAPRKLPKPPVYMEDLTTLDTPVPVPNTYAYEFSSWMSGDGSMGYGVNGKPFNHSFVNHSMPIDEPQEWELSLKTYGKECEKAATAAAVGEDAEVSAGHHNSKLPTGAKASAASESHCHEMTHPFHMHGSHFQVTRMNHEQDPEGLLFALGEWRDTIPLFHSNVQVRFTPRHHMVGRILTHCHFAAHSDNGMAQLVGVHAS